MVWFHSWAGLLSGWILYVICVTGSFAYVQDEVTRWMRPELPLPSATRPAGDLLTLAEDHLAKNGADAAFWAILFPGQRGADDLAVGWTPRPGMPLAGAFQRVILDQQTGAPVERHSRATGGGQTITAMHYALHYMSRDAGTLVVGAAAMLMFVVLLAGIAAHKKIFREFFTFRPGRGQQSWLDGHTTLAVTVTPFLLLMTWSGLIFSTFVYMPAAQATFFSDVEGLARFQEEAFQYVPPRPENRFARAAPVTSLHAVLSRAEQRWGEGSVSRLRVENPGRADAVVMVYALQAGISGETRLLFSGVTGEALPDPNSRTGPGTFYAGMLGLHKGYFARGYLRALFVLCGLASAGLIATGLVRWSIKRQGPASQRHMGHTVVAALNSGTIIGLPIGLAAYFWANRIVPPAMEGRETWEANALFIAWGVAFVYAAGRHSVRAWAEMCVVAGAAWGLLPVLNALTTERHLGVTVPAGDWVLAGFDLSALAAGIFFVALAWKLARKPAEAV